MTELVKQTTVKALIEENGKILMLKDNKGIWELPGGRIDNNDAKEETLKRELKEELDINNVEIGPKIYNFTFEVDCNDSKYQIFVIVCLCKINPSDLKISQEHTEMKWINIKKINDYPMREGYKKAISKYKGEKNRINSDKS